MKNKFYTLLLALVALAAILGYWYWQKNFYSKDTFKLEILSQDSVDFAKETEYVVKYKNNGNALLEDVKIIFEYPEHAIISDNKSSWQEIPLADIYPGEERTISFKARLVGKEGDIKTAKASLSYNPKNLKARYESLTTFTTQIKFVPLTFEYDMPSKIESGKTFKFILNYFSNADWPLSNLGIVAQYPDGFEFINSNPASLEKTDWKIPLLNKAEGGRIEITGSLRGEVGDQKLFNAKLGIWQDGEFVVLKDITKGLALEKPALLITQKINGSHDYTANAGDQLHYEIFFKNIGTETLNNLTLVDTLEGNIFDLQSLKTTNGRFTPGDNSIVWDWQGAFSLQFLAPQQENRVEFWINLKTNLETPSLAGQLTIKNNVYLNPAHEEFITKVNSRIEIIQKGFFQDEVFGNTGPIPPRVGQTTTYTINWQAKNYYNEVKNAKVKATLPYYIQLTGRIFPENSRMTFDSQSRQIVWEIGDMEVGKGVLNSPPNISFQVALLPNSLQVGQTLELISQTKIIAEDSWTANAIESAATILKTNLPDDPSIGQQGAVIL